MLTEDLPLASRIAAVEKTLNELRDQFASGGTSEVFYYKRLENLLARQHVLKQDLVRILHERNAQAVAKTFAVATSDANEEELTAAIAATTAEAQGAQNESWAKAWLETVGDTLHDHRGKLIDVALTGVIAVAKSLL